MTGEMTTAPRPLPPGVENQPPADQKYTSPGYRAGYAGGLASAEGVIAFLTARVAALEGRPLGHVHVASQSATDCEPVWIRPTIENAEPFVKPPAPPEPVRVAYALGDLPPGGTPPSPPEPVVGVVYRMADAQSDDSQRWKWIGEGKAASSWTPGVWLNPNEMLGAAVATLIRSGKLVPVTGKEGAQ